MSRFLPLGSTMNLRHMGGYKTFAGGTTRADKLYRSGFLNISGDAQLRQFEELAIKTIYDFRSPMERKVNNLQVSAGTQIVELGMLVASVENLWNMLLAKGLTPDGAEKIMAERYRELTEQEVPGYRTMFQHMAEGEGAILVMCSFGKDRAGIASALLLTSLGVGETGVTEDYLLSSDAYADKQAAINKFEQFFNAEGLPVDESIVLPILDARTAYLDTAWRVMRQKSGSIDSFMIEQLGVDKTVKERLIDRFVA